MDLFAEVPKTFDKAFSDISVLGGLLKQLAPVQEFIQSSNLDMAECYKLVVGLSDLSMRLKALMKVKEGVATRLSLVLVFFLGRKGL